MSSEQKYYQQFDDDQQFMADYIRKNKLLAYDKAAGNLPALDEDGSYKQYGSTKKDYDKTKELANPVENHNRPGDHPQGKGTRPSASRLKVVSTEGLPKTLTVTGKLKSSRNKELEGKRVKVLGRNKHGGLVVKSGKKTYVVKQEKTSFGKGKGVVVAGGKTKSEIAKKSAVKVDIEIQNYATKGNEVQFAKKIKGTARGDRFPVDVEVEVDGVLHGIELKTMVVSANRKLTMNRRARELKKKWKESAKNREVHTVVIDDSRVFNAKGKGKHDVTKRRYWYKRGYGNFHVDAMMVVPKKGLKANLEQLMKTPKDKLPKSAQSSNM